MSDEQYWSIIMVLAIIAMGTGWIIGMLAAHIRGGRP